MGCGHSKSDDPVSRVASAHFKKEFKKRRNSTKSTSSSSSSSSDDSKHVSKKGKKKKEEKDNVVSPVIKVNEDKILNNESQKPLTPTPKSASSRGSKTRNSSSSGFSEHEKDASSIDPNEVERKAEDEDGEKIFSLGGNDEEDINTTQKETGPTHENVTDIKEDGGEENQKANDVEMSQFKIIADDDDEEEEEEEDNVDGTSGNNENDNDTQQNKKQDADDEDLSIYEDNGNNNDIEDENDKTPGSVRADDFDDTEQQMNGYGEDVPDTFLGHTDDNGTEHNKSTEPSYDIVKYEPNEDYDRSDEDDKILTLTPRSEREREAEEDSLDVPDTFKME